MLALTALRAVVVWRFQRRAPAPPAVRRWGTLFGLGTLGAGLGWGCAGVVVSCRLAPASGVSGVCRRGHDRGRGWAARRTHGCVPEFCVPGGGADHCPLARPRRPDVEDHERDGDALTLVSIFTAWKLHCTIRTALHLRFDNADLVAAVTAEARVDASQRLEAEPSNGGARRKCWRSWPYRQRRPGGEHGLTAGGGRGRELCDSDGAAIALCEPGAEAAVICCWAGRPYRGFQGVRIEPGEGIRAWCWRPVAPAAPTTTRTIPA